MFPIAWKITRPNVNIVVPAGTPVATLIPVSLGSLANFELDLYDKTYDENYQKELQKKLEAWEKISKEGGFTNFYRNAVDYDGNSIGKHEVKSIILKINDNREKKEG